MPLLAVLALTVLVSNGTAAVPAKKAAPKSPTLVQTKTATVGSPVDTSITSVPPNFVGNDFIALYRKLSLEPKSEFETSQDYKNRVNGIQTSVLAFRIPNLTFTYNADAELFVGTLYTDILYDGLAADHNRGLLVLKESRDETGRYVGANAFGVSTTVTKVTERQWGVILNQRGFRPVELSVPVARRIAPSKKGQLAAFAICRVGGQSVPARLTADSSVDLRDATGFHISSATIDSPVDMKTYQYAINAALLGFWVVDLENGLILRRAKADGSPDLLATLSLGATLEQVINAMGRDPDVREEHTTSFGNMLHLEFRRERVGFDFLDGKLESILELAR
jgi:hypothetical protein